MDLNFETPQEKRKFFESKEVQELLAINEQEEKAIRKYQGTGALQINELMGNFISDNARVYGNESYYTSKFQDNIEKIKDLMGTVQSLYSAMIKKSLERDFFDEYRGGIYLYRGAAWDLKDEGNSFISTTTRREEALLFATSNNAKAKEHYFFDIFVDKDVLYLDMPRSGNENEVLISPFVSINNKDERRGEKNGTQLKIKNIEIASKPLRELSEEEMQMLENEVLENSNEMSNMVTECIILRNRIESLRDEIETAEESRDRTLRSMRGDSDYNEMKQYFQERIDGLYIQYDESKEALKQKSESISIWRGKIRLLMEGKCNQIEKTIHNQVEKLRENQIKQEEEKQRREAEALAKKKLEEEHNRNNAVQIRENIQAVKKASENALSQAIKMRTNIRRTGVKYDSPIERALSAINQMKYSKREASDKALTNIKQINELPQNLEKTNAELIKTEEEAFKRAIESKVTEIRLRQEERALSKELQEIKNEKLGVISRLSGKSKKQEEELKKKSEDLQRVRYIASQLQSQGLSQDARYSVHEMLAEIEFAKYKGMLSLEEMQELEKQKIAIVTVYAPFESQGRKVVPIREEKVKYELAKRINEDNENKRINGFTERIASKVSRDIRGKRRITMAERLCGEVNTMLNTIERTGISNDKDKNSYQISR